MKYAEWAKEEDRFLVEFFREATNEVGMYLWTVTKWRPSKGNESFDYPRIGDRCATMIFYSYMIPTQSLKDHYVLMCYTEDMAEHLEYKW